MNNYLQAILLAAVQGITEFLPISSSAHLQILPWLFGWSNPSLTFDAALHLGTACAVLAFYFKHLIKLVKDRDPLLKLILIGNIPAVVIGFTAENYIDQLFHQGEQGIPIIAIGLIVFGVVIWWVDKTRGSQRDLSQFKLADALTVGFAQSLALIPGVSRSGITLTAGRFRNLNRADATYVSFLLGIPVTLGAAVYKSLDIFTSPNTVTESLPIMIVGTVTSALVGILAIKWLLSYVKRHSLAGFMWYRIIFGLVILLFWYFK